MTELHNKGIVGMAWYRPEQWARLRELSEDVDQLETDYESWHRNAKAKMTELIISGINVEKVDVDIEALSAWCAQKKLKINGQTRSQYTTHILRNKHEPT
jgi:hypothetical protein